MKDDEDGAPDAPGRLGTLSGEEPLRFGGVAVGATVLDFWRWAGSDLLSNAQRGVFAEFIVRTALGLAGGPRIEWDPHDLISADGARIEVKSAAYCQSWPQRKPSRIAFDISPTRRFNYETGKYEPEARRQAEVYVFCLHTEPSKDKADVLNLDQWRFYVLAVRELDSTLPQQRSLSLSRLEKLGPRVVSYTELARAIASAWESLAGAPAATPDGTHPHR